MSLQYVNLTGFNRGIASNELGINCSRFVVEVEPEINDWLPGIDGQARGKAVGDPMGKLTIEGEVGATAGADIQSAVFQTAFIPVNSTTFWGRSAGGWYFSKGTRTFGRDEWRALTAELESKFNVP